MDGFSLIGTIVDVVKLLSGLFHRFSGKSTDLGTKQALEGVRSDVSSLGKTLTSAIAGVAGQLASAIGAIRRFIARVFGPLYNMLANLVTRVARILDRIFGPIVNFLGKVNFYLKQIYDKVIRPIIDTIEFVRSFLRLLEFFHVDWAKKLDAKLQQLEEWVLAPYQFMVAKINEISNWINRIVTLNGLLQRVMLLQSLLRDITYTNNLWWNSQSKPLAPGDLSGQRGVDRHMEEPEIQSAFESYVARDSGPFAAAGDEWLADLRLRLNRS